MLAKLVAIVLLCSASLLAQDAPKTATKTRRLEYVNWNPQTGKLTWAVSRGKQNEKGEFAAEKGKYTYEIDLARATMSHNGNARRFSRQEAANVLAVMEVISRYAQDSTIWWEQGKGDPLGLRVKLDAPLFSPLAPSRQRALSAGSE